MQDSPPPPVRLLSSDWTPSEIARAKCHKSRPSACDPIADLKTRWHQQNVDAEPTRGATGYALMVAAVLAYVARPWSCDLVLRRFSPEDPLPYAHFDNHGLGAMLAWLMALLFAAPILWLAAKLFLSNGTKLHVFGHAREARITILSILIAFGIALPMHSQLSYLVGLPTSITAPIFISSLAWLLVVELGRTAAVEGNSLDKYAVRIAVGLAVVVAVPKLALIGFYLSQT